MLTIFPELLVFGFFAPTIIRVAAAIAFAIAALVQWQRRETIANLRLPLIGKNPGVVWLSVAFHALVALMLLFGYYTQIAALLGVLGCLKSLWLLKHYPALIPYSRSTLLLLAAMLLSLMVSGAGALAQDLPL
jgi:uncharacterized membrane protein YphA (DoxX/SURF4 family)